MKSMVVAVLTAVLAGSAVQARVWTNTDGKTLEAELVKVQDGQVYLRLARDGKIRPLKIETLSEADQEFIHQYEKDEAARQKAGELAKRKAKWLTDYDDVKKEAERFDLPILLLFTAPEWCGYCTMLERNVLEQKAFKEYAQSNLVLFIADFSKPNDAKKWRANYPELATNFPVDGYPCAYLISPSGKQLGRIGGCSEDWTHVDYIGLLEKYKANAK